MNPIVRNILAVVAGIVVFNVLNMGIIIVGGKLMPPPAGVDPTNMESIKAYMHLFEPKHFVVPFLAHALATLIGAFAAAKIAATRKMLFAMVIGVLGLLGGIAACFMIPAPTWFMALDLIAAYIPMAWIGGKLGGGSAPAAAIEAE